VYKKDITFQQTVISRQPLDYRITLTSYPLIQSMKRFKQNVSTGSIFSSSKMLLNSEPLRHAVLEFSYLMCYMFHLSKYSTVPKGGYSIDVTLSWNHCYRTIYKYG